MRYNDPEVIERLKGWLDNFTYKPGFKFELVPAGHQVLGGTALPMPAVHGITPDWVDNRNPSSTSRGHFWFPFNIDLFSREEMFKSFIRKSVVHHMELHEADEQLLYKGVREWDPHHVGK